VEEGTKGLSSQEPYPIHGMISEGLKSSTGFAFLWLFALFLFAWAVSIAARN
jgi:hypothetical protein